MCSIAWFLSNIPGFSFSCQRHCTHSAHSLPLHSCFQCGSLKCWGLSKWSFLRRLVIGLPLWKKKHQALSVFLGPCLLLPHLHGRRKLRTSKGDCEIYSRLAAPRSSQHWLLSVLPSSASGSSWVILLPPLFSLNGKRSQGGLRVSLSQTHHQMLTYLRESRT